MLFPSSRSVASAFVADQWRPFQSLLIEGGARAEAGLGQLSYDTVFLFSGAMVWNFAPNWHLKANFSQGFRPPVFNNLRSYGGGIQFAGNPDIKSESSNAIQGELNARLLRDYRRVRELTLRADYSYTTLKDLISTSDGTYFNSGKRGISSAEFLARLELKGDHTLQLGYTFLDIADETNGSWAFAPSQWFTINSSFSLIRNRLELINTVLIASAALDPNRLPTTNYGNCIPGTRSPSTCGADAAVSDVTIDRIPAAAIWNIGVRWRGLIEGLELSAYVYNVLDQTWFEPDDFHDLSPQLTGSQPYPGPGRSVFASVRHRF
jgi:outer membrane receptor protein involved in Fe transport